MGAGGHRCREAEGRMRSLLREEQMWLITGCLMVLATLAMAAGLYYARGFMKPFVVALLITSIAAPIVDYQVVRLRFSKVIAVLTALNIADELYTERETDQDDRQKQLELRAERLITKLEEAMTPDVVGNATKTGGPCAVGDG